MIIPGSNAGVSIHASCVSDGVGRIHVHLGEYTADDGDQCSDVLGKYVPNGANPKAVRVAHFAGVDNEAEFAEPVVEGRKIKARMCGESEGGDDVALMLRRKVGIKAECGHAVDKSLAVGRVSRCPRLDATLLF